MRSSLFILAALLWAAPAAAQSSGSARPAAKPDNSSKLLPMKPPVSENSCAAYGPGFVKLNGTDTCVRVGGAVSVGVGGSAGGAH